MRDGHSDFCVALLSGHTQSRANSSAQSVSNFSMPNARPNSARNDARSVMIFFILFYFIFLEITSAIMVRNLRNLLAWKLRN